MYVIVRQDGAFVAPPGSEHSYTNDLREARTFRTREDAERERCPENETVMMVESLLRLPE